MDKLVLTARVVWEDGKYVARVDQLHLESAGDSVRKAQDELIHTMRSWLESYVVSDRLEQVLTEAGFSGVHEDTELQLEFVE